MVVVVVACLIARLPPEHLQPLLSVAPASAPAPATTQPLANPPTLPGADRETAAKRQPWIPTTRCAVRPLWKQQQQQQRRLHYRRKRRRRRRCRCHRWQFVSRRRQRLLISGWPKRCNAIRDAGTRWVRRDEHRGDSSCGQHFKCATGRAKKGVSRGEGGRLESSCWGNVWVLNSDVRAQERNSKK